MAVLMRGFDWAASPLGPVESWSRALRMMVRSLLANPFPMLLWWGARRIQFYNDACRPLLGEKHRAGALGLPGRECWAEIWNAMEPRIDATLQGKPVQGKNEVPLEIKPEGSEEEAFSLAFSPVPDETVPGGIGGVLATVAEAPEKVGGASRSASRQQKRVQEEMEQALRASEAQWKTLFEEAPLGIYLVDADFRIRAINPIARPFFGDIPGLIGRDFEEVIHILWSEEYAGEIARLFRHTLETGEPYMTPERSEERRDREGMTHYEWRIHRIPLSEGRDGVVCCFRDISEEVRARAEMAVSEEQRRRTAEGLRAIAARARCLLWYAEVEDRGEPSLHWTLRVADEEAARRFLPVVMPFGHSYGRALSEARLPEDRARMIRGDEEVRAGRSYGQEFRVRDASGNIRWLSEDVQIEEIGPKRWHAVGVCVDITERKRAEEERERHLKEIETLNNRLQRAMTETHHRVKNNLQLISAMIDMQRNASDERVPVSEFERLSANVRALSVIHDILTQEAKAGNGQETLSVKSVLDRLLQELAQTAGGSSLVSEIDDTRLAGRQTTTLALVTSELVSNALKHGRGQTEITFKTSKSQAALIVSDNGPGFPPDFDARTAAHTGLELVENIVQWDLRGQIAYSNRAEGGAQITVTFPLSMHPTE